MPLYITLSDLVYNESHPCLLNPLKYLQTCAGYEHSDQNATCKLTMQLALCDLLKQDAEHILHWNEGQPHL